MPTTTIRIGEADFNVAEETQKLSKSGEAGAVVSFLGVVRNANEGDQVYAMELEHYPGMTEKALGKIVNLARERWTLGDITVIHRVGKLLPGDQIVLVLVASAHRKEAFEACEYIMDWLKTEAPFWKKEHTPDGPRWVDARESDEQAKRRWQS
ncbi:MAG: molybdopterin synthase catalytic subunit MoaE [Sutterella sp.]|nr:molybdopterin synthase catalytic subunit MoaE [Sutterella sp.]